MSGTLIHLLAGIDMSGELEEADDSKSSSGVNKLIGNGSNEYNDEGPSGLYREKEPNFEKTRKRADKAAQRLMAHYFNSDGTPKADPRTRIDKIIDGYCTFFES
jgi:hypothetical protein